MANQTKKTECQITKTQFSEKATPLKVTINDQSKVAEVKEFSSGNLGWYLSDRVTVMIDGKPVKCMVNLSVVAIGSKDADE